MSARTNRSRAFTLIEILVVVGIVALLAAIVLGVGPRVIGGQQKAVTQATLRALDGMLDEFLETQGGSLPAFDTADYAGFPGEDLKTAGDERLKTIDTNGDAGYSEYPRNGDPRYPRFPDASVFIRAARGCCEVADNILAQLPPSQVRATVMPDDQQTTTRDEADPSPSVLDAWGSKNEWEAPFVFFDAKPVLFVHPKNLLAQAMYGKCVNNRAYFVSAGADRLYGTTSELTTDGRRDGADEVVKKAIAALRDNVYSYQPGPADIDPASDFNRNKR